jgi:hypothetical protein
MRTARHSPTNSRSSVAVVRPVSGVSSPVSGHALTDSDGVVDVETRDAMSIYESAIIQEQQGSLSEAVVLYRRAFKVSSLFPMCGS